MKRFVFLLLLLAGGSLVAAILMEAAVLLVVGEQAKFPRHIVSAPFGVRINEPNASYRHKSADVTVSFQINSKGLRADREFPYEKPKGVKRIVALGDSFTMGYEVAHADTFESVLERNLRDMGHSVEALNAGVSGYSNAEALLYLERELLRYEPDLVLLSFYGNDLVDNLRSHLFRLEGDELIAVGDSYVPAGRLGDFLNTNPVFNLLSERSNAFVFFKEKLTLIVKHQMTKDNLANLDGAENSEPAAKSPDVSTPDVSSAGGGEEYQRRLTAAILDRMLSVTQQHGIPLVIQSIPVFRRGPLRLVDVFPIEEFDTTREGVWFLSTKELLDPRLERNPLYHERSHQHWTPLSHSLSGQALARLIQQEDLL